MKYSGVISCVIHFLSSSSRRTWIEIISKALSSFSDRVVLLAEDVD